MQHHMARKSILQLAYILIAMLVVLPATESFGQYNQLNVFKDVFSNSIWSTGLNSAGQLGTMANTTQVPTQVKGVSGVTSLGKTGNLNTHMCAVISGDIKCWGTNTYGQLGDGKTNPLQSVVSVTGITTATAVAVAQHHTCAVLASGSVQCWGYNGYGQLGNGTTTNSSTPVTVTGISNAVAISVGQTSSCAALSSGSVQCWGRNDAGQLGDGTTTNSSTPVTVQGISTATDISVGFSGGGAFACARLSAGTVYCWGGNNAGQLGNGTTTSSLTPVQVTGITTATEIVGVSSSTCALLSGGTVNCWGYNVFGNLGNGGGGNSSVPVVVTGISTAVHITGGGQTACAVLSDNSIKCWGLNAYFTVGNRLSSTAATPQTVIGMSTVTNASGGSSFICALQTDQTVWCWGATASGILGDGAYTPLYSSAFKPAASVSGVIALTAGNDFACALISGGTIKCWGDNGFGSLGDGTGLNKSTPTTVSGITTATKVVAATGRYHACALLADGTVKCWGYSDSANYGVGNGYTTSQLSPVTISGISGATDIATGGYHNCALISGGTIKCWGQGAYGQLGNGSYTTQTTPVQVSGITTATAVVSGTNHSCAILADTTVKCWGFGQTYGALGNGATVDSATPVTVTGLSGVTALAAGNSNTCAILSGGSVSCWGSNNYGLLGDGTTTHSSTPKTVSGLSGVTKISICFTHAIAILSDKTIMAWGQGYLNGFGTGNFTDQFTPLSRGGSWSKVATGNNFTIVYP